MLVIPLSFSIKKKSTVVLFSKGNKVHDSFPQQKNIKLSSNGMKHALISGYSLSQLCHKLYLAFQSLSPCRGGK